MSKKLLTISYDGSKYQGYGTQPHHKTVQDTLELNLEKMFNTKIKTIASSRTDRGVHALDQKVMINIDNDITNNQLKKGLNSLLPNSIVVEDIIDVNDDFHPRFLVKEKTYKYIISSKLSPFNGAYKTYYPYPLNVDTMIEASSVLIGTHDFSSFCAAKTEVEDKVRTIYDINIIRDKDDIIITITGNGFLYNMIRIIVGTLIEVGNDKLSKEELKEILEKKDRKYAKKTFPSNGLYLVNIKY